MHLYSLSSFARPAMSRKSAQVSPVTVHNRDNSDDSDSSFHIEHSDEYSQDEEDYSSSPQPTDPKVNQRQVTATTLAGPGAPHVIDLTSSPKANSAAVRFSSFQCWQQLTGRKPLIKKEHSTSIIPSRVSGQYSLLRYHMGTDHSFSRLCLALPRLFSFFPSKTFGFVDQKHDSPRS